MLQAWRILSTSNRPLKVVFANRAHRKYLLDNARYISEKVPDDLKNVIISRDLTTEQKPERRNMHEQRAGQSQGAEVAEMPDGAPPPPHTHTHTPRMRFAEPDTVAMNLDQRPPSPIHGNYPGINEHEFMESQQAEYDQSTLIGDNTVIGGLSQENELSLTNAKAHS